VCVVKLNEKIIYSSVVGPVCLNDVQLRNDETGYVAGWGLTAELGSKSQSLMEISVPIVSDETCSKTYPSQELSMNVKHRDAVFYRADRLLYHKFENMIIFHPGNLYYISSGNQHYHKISYFLIFPSKKVKIFDQSSIIQNI